MALLARWAFPFDVSLMYVHIHINVHTYIHIYIYRLWDIHTYTYTYTYYSTDIRNKLKSNIYFKVSQLIYKIMVWYLEGCHVLCRAAAPMGGVWTKMNTYTYIYIYIHTHIHVHIHIHTYTYTYTDYFNISILIHI